MFKENTLSGKNILVTGGGTGLGRCMSERFVELGANVIITSRKEDILKKTCDEINTKFNKKSMHYKVCDISNSQSVDDMVNGLFAEFEINTLVNNAAGNFICRSEDLSYRAFDIVTKIVLNGTTYVTLACGKKWLEKKQKANVLSIVTTYASTGSAFVLPSAMGKAGVLAMTRSLAVEWGSKGIRFNAIAPGPFPTPGAWERLVPNEELGKQFETRNPLGRHGEQSELANLATFLTSDYSGFINGEVITIDGGEWLKGAGEFNFLEVLTDEEWKNLRKKS